jgi:hypothetical protein
LLSLGFHAVGGPWISANIVATLKPFFDGDENPQRRAFTALQSPENLHDILSWVFMEEKKKDDLSGGNTEGVTVTGEDQQMPADRELTPAEIYFLKGHAYLRLGFVISVHLFLITLIAGSLAVMLSFVVRGFDLDRRFKFFRVLVPWHYTLSGTLTGEQLTDLSVTKESRVVYAQVDQAEGQQLVTRHHGRLVDYQFRQGKLETLHLTSATCFHYSVTRSTWVAEAEPPPHVTVIPYDRVQNLNIHYRAEVKVSIRTLRRRHDGRGFVLEGEWFSPKRWFSPQFLEVTSTGDKKVMTIQENSGLSVNWSKMSKSHDHLLVVTKGGGLYQEGDSAIQAVEATQTEVPGFLITANKGPPLGQFTCPEETKIICFQASGSQATNAWEQIDISTPENQEYAGLSKLAS